MNNNDAPKLCKDCRHYRADKGGRTFDTCTNPELTRAPDLVRGESVLAYCGAMRDGKCGSAGYYWQPRPPA